MDQNRHSSCTDYGCRARNICVSALRDESCLPRLRLAVDAVNNTQAALDELVAASMALYQAEQNAAGTPLPADLNAKQEAHAAWNAACKKWEAGG